MRRKTDILVLLMALFMLTGCRLRRPGDVMSPGQMESFLYDYHLAQAVVAELPVADRYTTPAYMDWAYEKHNITKEDFERSLVWYTRYPKELAKIYKRLSNRVDDEYKSASKVQSRIEKKSYSVQSGDSVDLWYLNRICLLNTSDYMNKITTMTKVDTTFHLGDTIVWNLNNTFVCPEDSSSRWAYMSLSASYNDSISTVDTLLRESGRISLSLVLDKTLSATGIRTFLCYTDTADLREGMLISSDVDLMRYHRHASAADSVNVKSTFWSSTELRTDDSRSHGNVQ